MEVKEAVDVGDGDHLGPRLHLDDGVAGLDPSFRQHSHVEAGSAVRDEQRGHSRVPHADAEAVARHAGLRDLEDGVADPIPVAHADLVVGQTVDREVLAELAIGEIGTAEVGLPVSVRVELVHEDRSVLAAMPRQVALAVTVDVQPAHHATVLDRPFPDPGVDVSVPPRDVDGKPDIDGNQRRHRPRHPATLRQERVRSEPLARASGSGRARYRSTRWRRTVHLRSGRHRDARAVDLSDEFLDGLTNADRSACRRGSVRVLLRRSVAVSVRVDAVLRWDVESGVAVEEADGSEVESGVFDGHHRPVLWAGDVVRSAGEPQHDVGVLE